VRYALVTVPQCNIAFDRAEPASRISETGRDGGGSFMNRFRLRVGKLRTIIIRHAQSIFRLTQQRFIRVECGMLEDAGGVSRGVATRSS